MALDLNNWCRLCAKDNESEIDVNSIILQKFNLKELISKYFSITINIPDRTPKKICDDCYNFIEKLVKFNEYVEKANQMFLELLSNEDSMITHNNDDIREKYGIFESLKTDCTDESKIFVEIEPHEHVSISINSENSNDEIDDTRELKELQNEVKQTTRRSQKNLNSEKSITKKTRNMIKRKSVQEPKLEERSECNICHKTFSNHRVLQNHIKSFHSERQFECEICHKKFGTKKSLKEHGAAHLPYEQRYACPYCGKKFTKSVNIKPHIRTVHLGEKPFICEECGKAFGTKRNLMGHMYTHNTEAIYKCSHCDKEFKNKYCLQVHEDIHSKNIYICSKCGAQLKTRSTLNMHMYSVHSDVKKYKCERCGMDFRTYMKLKRHLISHLGLKPYSCQFCNKTYASNKNCRIHINKVHANEIPALELIGSNGVKITNSIPSLDQLKIIVAQASLS